MPHPSKRIGEDTARIYFVTVLPGFSILAITGAEEIPEPMFAITALVIEPEQPKAGDEIMIRAMAKNVGPTLSVYPSTLWINNEPDRHLSVVLEPGQSAPISFRITRPEGNYRIRVEKLIEEFAVLPALDVQQEAVVETEVQASGSSESQSTTPPSVGDFAPTNVSLIALLLIALTLIVGGGYLASGAGRRESMFLA